jgi:hypothetical protein
LSTFCRQLNTIAAREGGTVAGNARRELEQKSGKRVVTTQNFLVEKPKPKLQPPAGEKP